MTAKPRYSHMTWTDLCAVKSPEEDKIRKTLLQWAENILKQERAKPVHDAISALHNQNKSRAHPYNYRLPE